MAERTPQDAEQPAVVVQRSYDLALWLLRKVEKFPRSFRFSLGDRAVARSLELLESLVESAYAADKRAALERAARNVNSLRFLLRLSEDLKLLSADSHEFASGRLEEIGRMTGGWRKAASRRGDA